MRSNFWARVNIVTVKSARLHCFVNRCKIQPVWIIKLLHCPLLADCWGSLTALVPWNEKGRQHCKWVHGWSGRDVARFTFWRTLAVLRCQSLLPVLVTIPAFIAYLLNPKLALQWSSLTLRRTFFFLKKKTPNSYILLIYIFYIYIFLPVCVCS